ncbi:MAG: sulfatase-like hydrolase/transferase [Planctomycetes bacterium]|nr:sulfatase-like hydrolase/transferase [Planctomycetota bacterium]
MASPTMPVPTAPKNLPPVDHNVLLVVIDDVGAEWWSFYGIGDRFTTDPQFTYPRTPTITRLAQFGLTFLEAYANPVCGPTRACIQTGQHAFRTGFGENLRDPGSMGTIGHRLSDALNWQPRAIHQARPGVYDTGIVGKWHIADGYSTVVPPGILTPPDANLDHAVAVGYDYSSIHMPNNGDTYAWHRIVNGVVMPAAGYSAPPYTNSTWAPSVHAADAIQWINSRTKPWFLHLAFNAPHSPFTVPPFETLSAQTINELTTAGLTPGFTVPTTATYAQVQRVWRASMESVDHALGLVLASMPATELAKTMVIVYGDNGTVINALPPGFLHSKRDVYRGGTQVPLVINGPLVVNPGRQPTALAHAVDIHATVLDIVGGRAPAKIKDMDGISLMPAILDQPGKRRRVLTEVTRPWGETNPALLTLVQRAFFDGRWRYVNRGGPDELYDNHADFLEAVNVAAANPAITAQMKREVEELVGG